MNEKFMNIDIGAYDYVLKCIDGSYVNKFIYLNTAKPEVIGGSHNYDLDKNPASLTMFIESSNLVEKHVAINFNSSC